MTWQTALKRAIERNEMSSAYSLSTAENGQPRVRTLIHRGFLKDPDDEDRSASANVLYSTTDFRSPKVSQILGYKDNGSSSPFEIAWYFPKSVEQFRLRGHVYVYHPSSPHLPLHIINLSSTASGETKVDWESIRSEVFRHISPAIKASFIRPVPGSQLQSPNDIAHLPQKLYEREDGAVMPQVEQSFENMALLIFDVNYVDHVNLNVTPHQRCVYRYCIDHPWSKTYVSP